MLEIYTQTSYDQNVQLILKSYLPVVYGTLLSEQRWEVCFVDIGGILERERDKIDTRTHKYVHFPGLIRGILKKWQDWTIIEN